jgi:hypothetical protein
MLLPLSLSHKHDLGGRGGGGGGGLDRSQERTQRFTNHAYVEPRQLDIYRFMISTTPHIRHDAAATTHVA